MNIYKFFIKRLFKKRIIFSFIIIMLFIMCSFSMRSAGIGFVNLYLGCKQFKQFESRNAYVSEVKDDGTEPDVDYFDKKLPIVYDYFENNYTYAGYAPTHINPSLFKCKDGFAISEAYLMEEYYKTVKFKLSKGEDLYFDFKTDGTEDIPILVGANIADDYPIGTRIKTEAYPGFEGEKLTYKVVGVLKANTFSSNVFMYHSLRYHNYDFIIPIVDIKKSYFLSSNYLYNEFFVFDSNKAEIDKLTEFIHNEIDDNIYFKPITYFRDREIGYSFETFQLLAFVVFVITILIAIISLWIFVKFIRLLLKDFTINIIIGLGYKRLEKIFRIYLSILAFTGTFVTTLLLILYKYLIWIDKDNQVLITNGLFGIRGAEYLLLFISLIVNIIIVFVVTKISIKRIKKIPISIGVLG